MSTRTIPNITALPVTASGYTILVDTVAIELTFDPTDLTYGLAYAWAPDDYADGFTPEQITDAVAEWVELAPEDHPTPWDGCYGCLGTGTIDWAGVRSGIACSCVSVEP